MKITRHDESAPAPSKTASELKNEELPAAIRDQARWDQTQALGDAMLQRANEVDAAAVVLAETLEGLQAAQVAFESSQPARWPGYVSLIRTDGVRAAEAAVRQRLHRGSLQIPKLATIATEELAAVMRLRPAKEQERSGRKTAPKE
jgi:hypothetical protein